MSGKPRSQEAAEVKDQCQIHTQIIQHPEQINMAALPFITAIRQQAKALQEANRSTSTPSDHAQISSANGSEIYTDFQRLDLMDSPQQLNGQGIPPTNQQPHGQDRGRIYFSKYTVYQIYV